MFDIVTSYHCMQFQGKIMNQTWENGKKTNFGPNFDSFGPNLGYNFFSWVLPLLDVRHCCKLSFYTISKKANDPNWRKWQKKLILGLIWAQIRAANFFFFFSKIWLRQSLDIMASYHHVQYQKKLMIQSWENLVTDRRKDRWTNRRMRIKINQMYVLLRSMVISYSLYVFFTRFLLLRSYLPS